MSNVIYPCQEPRAKSHIVKFNISNIYLTILIAFFIAIFLPNKVASQLWEPIGPCYEQDGCTVSQHSKVVEIMGCSVTVIYQVIACGQKYQYQIDKFIYSSGGNCAALHLYLHPLPGNVLNPDRYADVKKQLYNKLFMINFDPQKNTHHCPNYIEYTFWWEGSCAMACETILVNGEHVFQTLSCQELACCGKRYLYCYDPILEKVNITEQTYWVGTACPPQTRPFIDRCPEIGDYFNGVLIVDQNVTYCISNCFEE